MTDRFGTYELLETLGQGGMADVYLARPAHGGVPVALKVLNQARSQDAESCALFLDEARVAALLDHPNIAAVLDANVAGGLQYLAIEYIDGADLREMLAACSEIGSLPSYEVALSIVAKAAAGLDHAHRRCGPDGKPLHLVHRDVSLTNIMVGYDGSVKVLDFGIARSTLSSVHTSPGIVRGKASYMSPEQCTGDAIDHRTDVFALGIVLYELTTGARCFAGKSDFERMVAVVQGDYIAPSDLVADYPAELEQVVRTALAASPEHRYASCAAMIDALERVMAHRGWSRDTSAIRAMMEDLFDTTKVGGGATAHDARTVESYLILPQMAEPTRELVRPRCIARGTLSDMFDPKYWPANDEAAATDDDDDALTRGRAPVRRPSVPFLAA